MKLKEVNQEYHFEKAKLKQWLIDQGLIEPHDHRDIYQLECDTEMIQMIDDDQYAIRHTVVRKKFQTIDDYQAPAMIPMDFRILNIHNFVILDTETTGLYKDDEVIELSIIDTLGRELYHSLFCPTKKMGEAAIRVTGLDYAMLKEEPLFKDEWPKIKKAIGSHIILGHNIAYDYRVTLSTAKRYGIAETEVKDLFRDMIDSKALVAHYYQSRSYKLAYLCKKFGITESQKHRATYDCLQTLQMLRALEHKLVNEGYQAAGDTYDLALIQKEKKQMEALKEAALYGYKAGKSIEDLSVFYSLSEDEVTSLVIDAYHQGLCEIRIDTQKEENVLFIARSIPDLTFDQLAKKAKKYASENEIRLIMAKEHL